jgi:hypothetical protein
MTRDAGSRFTEDVGEGLCSIERDYVILLS